MLNIYTLARNKDKKEIIKLRNYKKILSLCHKHISMKSKQGQTYTIYRVPMFVFGLPLYDYELCKEYIYNRLLSNKFICKYGGDQHLYISWAHIDSNRTNEKEYQEYIDKTTNKFKITNKLQTNKSPLSYNSSNVGELYTNLYKK